MIRIVLRDGRQMLVPEADVLVWAELVGAELVTLERVHVLLPLLRVLAMAQRVTA